MSISWKAYVLFVGAVVANAWLVTSLSHIPALAAFAATLGGTLAGALGFQVLARVSAWAKQTSSAGGTVDKGPFAPHLMRVWGGSQVRHCDLTRDGRNIRKDAWLQLHHRFCVSLHLPSPASYNAVAEAIVDHLLTFPEVPIDDLMAREFRRLLALRFDASDYWIIVACLNSAATRTGLEILEAKSILNQILPSEPMG